VFNAIASSPPLAVGHRVARTDRSERSLAVGAATGDPFLRNGTGESTRLETLLVDLLPGRQRRRSSTADALVSGRAALAASASACPVVGGAGLDGDPNCSKSQPRYG